MTAPLFVDLPSVELLQWLARGSLKQNLARAIRLWVWLCFLYGEAEQASLPQAFSFADWREAFFSNTHPTGEAIPPCMIAIAGVPRRQQSGYSPLRRG